MYATPEVDIFRFNMTGWELYCTFSMVGGFQKQIKNKKNAAAKAATGIANLRYT